MKYHGHGGPWLRRGLWRGASETTGGEFNSARTRLWRDLRGTGNTRTHRKCHRNRGRLLLPWRVSPWASAPSRGRDTGPAHRVLPRSGCAGFARPITWVPNWCRASQSLKTGTQPSVRASPLPTVGRGTRAAFHLEIKTQCGCGGRERAPSRDSGKGRSAVWWRQVCCVVAAGLLCGGGRSTGNAPASAQPSASGLHASNASVGSRERAPAVFFTMFFRRVVRCALAERARDPTFTRAKLSCNPSEIEDF